MTSRWWVPTGDGPRYFKTKREAVSFASDHKLCAFRQTRAKPRRSPAGFNVTRLDSECVYDGREQS